MSWMFSNTSLSTTNYENTLKGWSALTLQNNVNFNGGYSKYCDNTGRQAILTNFSWTIYDGGEDPACTTPNAFVTTWRTDSSGTSNSTSITIPTFTGETYNYDVDWDNDGTFDEIGLTGNVTHDFGTAGYYTIRIRGQFPRIYFNNLGDKRKFWSIDQWGNQAWTSMENAFFGCIYMNLNANDTPKHASHR